MEIRESRNPFIPLCNFNHDCLNKGDYDRKQGLIKCYHCIRNGKTGKFVNLSTPIQKHFVIGVYQGDFWEPLYLPEI